MDEYVVWGDHEKDRVVQIEQFGGVDDLLKPGTIEAESKTPGLKALGVILDANDSLDSRWLRVHEQCRRVAADFPVELPPGGLIHARADGLRIGVWIMPDNRSRGMLETFLSVLVTLDQGPLWAHAGEDPAIALAAIAPRRRRPPRQGAYPHVPGIGRAPRQIAPGSGPRSCPGREVAARPGFCALVYEPVRADSAHDYRRSFGLIGGGQPTKRIGLRHPWPYFGISSCQPRQSQRRESGRIERPWRPLWKP